MKPGIYYNVPIDQYHAGGFEDAAEYRQVADLALSHAGNVPS